MASPPVQAVTAVSLSEDPNYVVVKIAKQTADGEIIELVFRSLKSDLLLDLRAFLDPLHERMKSINVEKLSKTH